MTRGRLLTLLAVVVALIGAFALRPGAARHEGPTRASATAGQVGPPASAPPTARPDPLASLRAKAALTACPTGLSAALPDLVLGCLGGGPAVHLRAQGSGLPTLVNVYGSWCGPCQEEMPVLTAFARRAGGRVALVGVDTNDDPRMALQFASDVGQHWPAVVDDDKAVLRRYSSGPPVTLFLDGSGRLAYVKRGPFRSLADLRATVSRELGVRV